MQNRGSLGSVFHLMQLCDSALPVGGFSFSCALESAAEQGAVRDAATLEEYIRTVVSQTLRMDGVAALHAFRNSHNRDRLHSIDALLHSRKPSLEWRTMSCRMGRKLAELGAAILPCPDLDNWLGDITAGRTPGSYATTQGLLFSLCGAHEEELFTAVGYGTATMIAGAALRLLRVTHLDTQRIIFSLADLVERLYGKVSGWSLDKMEGFAPQVEILSSLHERGKQRMFMS